MLNIFRLYDIRGVYPNEINFDTAQTIGRALAVFAKQKLAKDPQNVKIVVGRDNRASSPEIFDGFTQGLLQKGVQVTDLGLSLTPIIHYLTKNHDFDLGIEVTASHNPPQFNGLRIDHRGAIPFYGDDVKTLEQLFLIEQNTASSSSPSTVITAHKHPELNNEYFKFLQKRFTFKLGLKIVVNCGYGTLGYFADQLLVNLGIEVKVLNCMPNSKLPHGTPDPENKDFMAELKTKMLQSKADLGIALDEDCDRFGVVDENGMSYENDKVLLLFAKHLLKNPKNKNQTIAYDVKCSAVLDELIKKWGGQPKMVRTGHPYFVQELTQGALLAGEFSGHAYFAENGYDDGIYAALQVLEIMSHSGRPLSQLMSEFPKRWHTSEIKIACSDNKKFEIVEKIAHNLRRGDFIEVNTLDGVRAGVSAGAWFLLRPSNTSPYLSLRAEAASREELSLVLAGVKSLLAKFKELDLSVVDKLEPFLS